MHSAVRHRIPLGLGSLRRQQGAGRGGLPGLRSPGPAAAAGQLPASRARSWRLVRAAAGPSSGSAPVLADTPQQQQQQQPQQQHAGGGGGGPGPSPPPSSFSAVRALYNRALRGLAKLQLAIAELVGVAALSAVGTLIPQGQPAPFYLEHYPAGQGWLTGELILALQWDHVYTASYFYLLIALWAASLAACTATTQWPAVRVAQRWQFREGAEAIARLECAEVLPNARLQDVAAALAARQYQVFLQGGSLYAFKGLAGKVGPIGVHASMLLALLGICMGLLGGLKGTAMVPEGTDLLLASALHPASPLAQYPAGASAVLHVDDFRIDYRPDGSIRQFYTDATLRDLEGRPLAQRTLSVNQPLRYGGVTAYQTDWSMAALTVRAVGSPLQPADGTAFNLPMASLAGAPGAESKLYATFIPAEQPSGEGRPRGVSVLAKDLQSVVFYDSRGEFAGVRRPGSGKPISVEGLEISVEGVLAGTGLELKHDPGVPFAYAGFGGMCLTTVVSYISHSQVWAAAEPGGSVVLGGRSNRAKFGFRRELEEVLDAVPEVLPPAPSLK